MRRLTISRLVYQIAAIVQYVAAGVATLIGATLKTKPERWGDFGVVLGWIQEHVVDDSDLGMTRHHVSGTLRLDREALGLGVGSKSP
jgi:hypothetical protein